MTKETKDQIVGCMMRERTDAKNQLTLHEKQLQHYFEEADKLARCRDKSSYELEVKDGELIRCAKLRSEGPARIKWPSEAGYHNNRKRNKEAR